MKKVKMCGEKPCSECPFANDSMRGFLADYTIDDLLTLYRFDVPFPCHKTMSKGNVEIGMLRKLIQSGKMQVCRGYLEMMKKSCKRPEGFLADIFAEVEVSDRAMNTMEFVKHHTIEL